MTSSKSDLNCEPEDAASPRVAEMQCEKAPQKAETTCMWRGTPKKPCTFLLRQEGPIHHCIAGRSRPLIPWLLLFSSLNFELTTSWCSGTLCQQCLALGRMLKGLNRLRGSALNPSATLTLCGLSARSLHIEPWRDAERPISQARRT